VNKNKKLCQEEKEKKKEREIVHLIYIKDKIQPDID
jgi:hypothetical protein